MSQTMSCTARIRPFVPVNDGDLRCERAAGHASSHASTLRDYAHPGSATVINWQEADRRTFHDDWPGACTDDGCILPDGHHGGHAS